MHYGDLISIEINRGLSFTTTTARMEIDVRNIEINIGTK